MGYGKCHKCVKFGTPDCPTSSECMALDELPFFEPKPKKKINSDFDGETVMLILGIMAMIAVPIMAIILC